MTKRQTRLVEDLPELTGSESEIRLRPFRRRAFKAVCKAIPWGMKGAEQRSVYTVESEEPDTILICVKIPKK
jgi:hypothetical protein